jgi:hypothetical protein
MERTIAEICIASPSGPLTSFGKSDATTLM